MKRQIYSSYVDSADFKLRPTNLKSMQLPNMSYFYFHVLFGNVAVPNRHLKL